ncbi:MAG: RagB/SusD family nutrient uptake outer membrane protein [Bacteroidales bacterium]|nr:RagB/SusD family nutrient uptake outer membrane protein [Bacteroidales bacterium]
MNRLNIIVILTILIFATSCEDYLADHPDFGLTEEVVFANYESARGYLDNSYSAINNFMRFQNAGRPHMAAMSDEAVSSIEWIWIYPFTTGDWFNKAGHKEVGWNRGTYIGDAFWAIRICNKLLENLDVMESLTTEQFNDLAGQAYFLRAWFYFEIIRRWGGTFIVDKAYTGSDDLDLPRLNYWESNQFVIDNCNSAIDHLPDEWPQQQTGRPTKLAAMALKGMAQLYAASPLMRNPVDQLVEYTEYDEERARTAAEYIHEAIQYVENPSNAYLKKYMQGDPDMFPSMTQEQRDSTWRSVFYHKTYVGDESIWYINSTGKFRDPDMACQFQNQRWSGRKGNYGEGHADPTQEAVDWFETLPGDGNAYPVSHAASQYDDQNPYIKRDPRFYNSIMYNARPYGIKNSGDTAFHRPWRSGVTDAIKGDDYKPNVKWQENLMTSYLCVKWWWPEAHDIDFSGSGEKAGYGLYYYNTVHIRTTQLYLDYAEAMNEAYGPTNNNGFTYSAVEAINKVRARVGMPPVLAEYTTSKAAFRDRIRNERAVELFFENHRWHDTRRWMIAKDIFEGTYPLTGAVAYNMTVGETNPSNMTFRYEYQPVTFMTGVRNFEMKHYWYPLPKLQVEELYNFKQNPGW